MLDEDVQDALRAELAERMPPSVRGGLAEVVSRGRRRRRTQQFGAVLGVTAAIAGSAVAAVAFGGSNAMPPADPGPTVTSTAAAWPRAALPAHTPYGTWTPGDTAPPPAGWQVMAVPRCDIGDTSGRNVDSVPASAELRQRVADAAHAVAGDATVGELVEQHLLPSRPDTVDAYSYSADITDAGGTGSVTFSIGAFTGAPLAAADEQAFDEFNCDPPRRHVLVDGTVLQIYAMQPSEPFQSLSQVLRIYRPGGALYTVTVHNFGSPDFAPNPDQPEIPNRVGPGRETLPLSENQLADLGLAVSN